MLTKGWQRSLCKACIHLQFEYQTRTMTSYLFHSNLFTPIHPNRESVCKEEAYLITRGNPVHPLDSAKKRRMQCSGCPSYPYVVFSFFSHCISSLRQHYPNKNFTVRLPRKQKQLPQAIKLEPVCRLK